MSVGTSLRYGTTVVVTLTSAWALSRVFAYWNVRRKARGKPLPMPPNAHWFLGHLPLLKKRIGHGGEHIDVIILEFEETYKELGRLWALKFPLGFQFVVVTDPEAAKEVLVTQNFEKSPTYASLHPFIGHKSLVVSSHEVWAPQRKAFNPGFSYQFLRTVVPVFTEKAGRFVEKLRKYAVDGGVLRLHEMSTLLTLDVICKVALSRDFKLLDCEEPPELYTLFMKLLNATAVYASAPHLTWTRYLPWNYFYWRSIQRKFDGLLMAVIRERLAEAKVAHAAAARAAAAAAAGAITASSGQTAEAAAAASPASPAKGDAGAAGVGVGVSGRDILSLAIHMQLSSGDRVDMDDLLSQVKTFLFAGHDTTATTIAFAVYEISLKPEVEAKVLEEVDRVCCGRTPTSEDLNQLKYIGAVVKETLRMWPPGGTARMPEPGSTLMGYDVGGKVLYVPHYPIHRDTQLYGPDANEFRPARWQDEAYVASLHPFAYQPFSKGPRDCIGQTFANLEARALLAMMYQHYTFKHAGAQPEQPAYKITTCPKFGVQVTVHARS